jgi:transketolase
MDIESSDVIRIKEAAQRVRRRVIRMTYLAGSGHPGGSLSATDIITCLYLKVLRHNPEDPGWHDRDRFILSKGHACPALYAVLAECGYITEEELWTLRKLGSRLQGHPELNTVPGIDAPAGSEGQGLGIGCGMALAARLEGSQRRVYVMLGDGECDAGNTWESALFAAHQKLDNLTAIIDRNRLQQDDECVRVLDTEPLAEKWRAFNWHVIEIDGHDISQILDAFEKARSNKGRPSVIVARTIKGKGVSFMENNVSFHGKPPNQEEYERAMRELGGNG